MAFVVNSQNATTRNTLVTNLLSSLQASLGQSGNTVEGLFSNILSSNQAANATANASANNKVSAQNDRGNDNNQVQARVSAGPHDQSNWKPQARNVHRADAQSPKSQSNAADNAQPDNNAKTVSVAETADNNKSTPVKTDNNNNDSVNTTDTTANASTTTTTSDDSNTLPTDTSVSAAAASAAQLANQQTVTAAVTADVTVTADVMVGANTDQQQDPKNKDAVSDELLSLLLQLERIAAVQVQSAASLTTSAQTTTTQPTDPTKAAPTTDSGPNLDLKALLDTIARLNQSNNNDGSTDDGDASLATSTAFSADVTASTTSSATASQQPPTQKTSADALLNLLNSVPTNQSDAPQPVAAFNISVLANAMAGDQDDQASSDLLNQNGDGSRNAANTAAADKSALPLPTNNTQAANPYDFASQLSAMRATRGGTTGLPAPVEQVMLQLSRTVSKDGTSQMTIQLKPAELGRVDVKLSISSDGKVQGTVTADNSATLGLLLKDVRGLERALQEAGLRADPGSLQFSLRGDGQQPGSGFGQAMGGQSGSNNNGSGFETDGSLSVYNDATETYYLTPGGVNMRV